MQIRVVSLDDEAARLLATGGGWAVQARFERALILASADDGALLSLARHELPDGPFTARLEPGAPRDLRALERAPRLDLAGARRWRAPVVAAAEAVDLAELLRRLRLLEATVAAADVTGKGIGSVARPADLDALESALAGGDPRASAEAAARLAGLGPGLTPSGDDLLAGALGFDAWAEAAGLGPPHGALREAVCNAALSRTTRLAGQLLAAAARGHVTAPLAALLVGLLGRAATFPPDIAPLLAVGETSGADMLAGVRLSGRAHVARRD